MQDDGAVLEPIQSLTGDAKAGVVFLEAREIGDFCPLPFELDTEHIGHIAPGEGRIHIVTYLDP